jgi:hypothetical protein
VELDQFSARVQLLKVRPGADLNQFTVGPPHAHPLRHAQTPKHVRFGLLSWQAQLLSAEDTAQRALELGERAKRDLDRHREKFKTTIAAHVSGPRASVPRACLVPCSTNWIGCDQEADLQREAARAEDLAAEVEVSGDLVTWCCV